MSQIISIILQSGGSGKTTTACNLAFALQSMNKKVLCCDLDSQSNMSLNLGFKDIESLEKTIYEVLLGDTDIEDAIYETPFNIDLIPSKSILSSFFITALTNPKKYPTPFYILKNALNKISNLYDYIIIDNPPSLDFYTVSSLAASHKILIPMQCEPKSIRGLEMLFDAFENVKSVYNPNLEVLGIVGTMFNRGTNISTTVLQEVRKKYDGLYKVFDSVIYRTVKFSESDLFHKPALAYSNNEQVKEYFNLAKEVVASGN